MAVVPALPGCYTEGETEAEARELVEDAICLHVEDRLERGEPIDEEVGSSIHTKTMKRRNGPFPMMMINHRSH